MRTIVLSIAFAALAGVAVGAPALRLAPRSKWKVSPTAADFARLLSPEAKAAKSNIWVNLQCDAAASGALSDCIVKSALPSGVGVEQSALELSRLIKVGSPIGGGSAAGRVLVPIFFRVAATYPSIIENVDWLSLPTAKEILAWARLSPAQARGHGSTAIDCLVNAGGDLESCYVQFEYPAGSGYGEAALRIAPHIRMKPQLRDGEPVNGGKVVIPFKF